MSAPATERAATCDMESGCVEPVSHLDQNGFLYCTKHGLMRRASRPCRQLRTHELNRLKRGAQITRY